MAHARRTVTIRFEAGDGPITGTVAADGEEIGFAGWIELAALIDRLHSRAAAEAGSDGSLSPVRLPSQERPRAQPET